MSDNRPMRYVDEVDGDKAIIWRASSLGACDRAIVATALGLPAEPKPQWFRDALDEGTTLESQIRELWDQESGVVTVNDQREVHLLVGEVDDVPVYVRGHIDGERGDDENGVVLREFKKARESTHDKFVKAGIDHMPSYPWQVSVYMLGIGATRAEFVIGKCVEDEWGKPYISGVTCVDVPELPHSLKEIRQRVMRVERQIAAGYDAMEIGCDVSMYPCPYYKLHDIEDIPEVEGDKARELVDVMVQADHKITALRARIKPYETEKREAADKLRDLLATTEHNDTDKFTVAGVQITRVRRHVPERTTKAYDMDFFKIKAGG